MSFEPEMNCDPETSWDPEKNCDVKLTSNQEPMSDPLLLLERIRSIGLEYGLVKCHGLMNFPGLKSSPGLVRVYGFKNLLV